MEETALFFKLSVGTTPPYILKFLKWEILKHIMSLSHTTYFSKNEAVYSEGNTKKGLVNFRTNLTSKE